MPHYNLALLGFGNVGRALARLFMKKQTDLLQRYNLTFTVTGIATGRHGAAIDLDGLDLERALTIVETGNSLEDLSGREMTIRPSSSYYESLKRLNNQLKKERRKPIKLVKAFASAGRST